ncbi:MAG: LysR family transcriptional regulator [Rhodospirillaceae bacterium]|jgi:LysR family transcriptional regulator, nitrogen assimilation regulatory protein|nr:LysR family transcriptional regulator [Rhodospirillaceae bacterium]MBT5239713.1 LysR family transcriptional regulator [Rhodospirillaceae bacterium]MBT5567257.1 LysR family transcriptional regulator [Rhodospirillaceae bacterium]MBT6962229.1 LysR family transcriptional regulator [Rhodospirillaceae bacterium]MBT7449796.1 LysR family transcriptional regulator [Rhodospirillaceae bacterium]
MKLQHLRTFVAVYQERSFTAAAERINATQSGLSMQIKELEKTLRCALFDRSPAGVVPTPAGERFYLRAASILNDLSESEEELRGLEGELTGTVTVGLMPTFSRAALPRALNVFTQRYPHVRLDIVEAYSGVLSEAVVRGEVDFAIVPPTGAHAGIRSQHIARDCEIFVTSLDTSRTHLEPVILADCGSLNLIVPGTGNARRARIDTYLAGVGANVDKIIEMDAMMGTLEVVAQSDWAAILPGAICLPDLPGHVRKLHPIKQPTLSVDYVLIQPAVGALSPAAQQFTTVLIKEIQDICGQISDRLGRAT